MLGVGADTGEPEQRRQKPSRSVGGIPPPAPATCLQPLWRDL